MRIQLHCQKVRLTTAEREDIERRVMFGLGRFAARIRHLAITLSDTNGVRGGVDKRCRIVARIPGIEDLFVEDEDHDLPMLFNRAIGRMGHLVGRRLKRLRLGFERTALDGIEHQERTTSRARTPKRDLPSQ